MAKNIFLSLQISLWSTLEDFALFHRPFFKNIIDHIEITLCHFWCLWVQIVCYITMPVLEQYMISGHLTLIIFSPWPLSSFLLPPPPTYSIWDLLLSGLGSHSFLPFALCPQRIMLVQWFLLTYVRGDLCLCSSGKRWFFVLPLVGRAVQDGIFWSVYGNLVCWWLFLCFLSCFLFGWGVLHSVLLAAEWYHILCMCIGLHGSSH